MITLAYISSFLTYSIIVSSSPLNISANFNIIS
nr:MAG TPA: hypothetical protein [Caudoviricetes sp.]